jgi:predicted nucleic acid-binding protein
MKPVVLLADANVFLRFLRNDHAEHSPAARQVMEQAVAGEIILRVQEIVVADIFYTLTAPMMKIPRAAAARQLAALLQQPGIEVENRSRVLDILGLCETKNIDYGDAALMVAPRMRGNRCPSFPTIRISAKNRRLPRSRRSNGCKKAVSS